MDRPRSSDPVDAPTSDDAEMAATTALRQSLPADAVGLRDAWQRNAEDWIEWARAPMHDSYWRFHRDQFLDLLPRAGALTLDIGAGEGRLSRDLARLGHRIVAIDASHTLAAAARDVDAATRIVIADAAVLPLRDGVADLAVAFMSLQDVDDLTAAVHEAARVLAPGGRLCVAIVHPLNSAGQFETGPDARFVIDGAYLEQRAYVDEVRRDGLTMRFASIHRPLEQYMAAFGDAGFLLERLREPAMPDHALRSPERRQWQRLPLFLHLRMVKP